jgi:hypothetical protein
MKELNRVYSSAEHCELAIEFAQYQSDMEDRIEILKKLCNSQLKLITVLKNQLRKYENGSPNE